MKDSAVAKIIGIFLILLLLFLTMAIEGCATKGVEVIRYCADYHLYDSKVEMQFNSGRLSSINGFHRTTDTVEGVSTTIAWKVLCPSYRFSQNDSR